VVGSGSALQVSIHPAKDLSQNLVDINYFETPVKLVQSDISSCRDSPNLSDSEFPKGDKQQ